MNFQTAGRAEFVLLTDKFPHIKSEVLMSRFHWHPIEKQSQILSDGHVVVSTSTQNLPFDTRIF